MGALLAFELARRLGKDFKLSPRLLVVSACGAPQLPRINQRMIHDLPEPDFLEEIRKLEGTPLEVLENAELRRLVLPALRADLGLVETYQYKEEPPLDCPILALAGIEDPEVPLASILSWKHQTLLDFELEKLPAGHFFVQSHGPQVLEILGRAIHRLGPLPNS